MNTQHTGRTVFSFFSAPVSNTAPRFSIWPYAAFRYLISDTAAHATDLIRAETSADRRRELKRYRLDFITPGCVVSRRALSGILSASGLMVLDFDHLRDAQGGPVRGLSVLSVVAPLWSRFCSVLGFVSPSGDGYKLIIDVSLKLEELSGCAVGAPLQSDAERQRVAEAYKCIYAQCGNVCASLGFELDKSGSDITRACYLPHDAQPRISYDAVPKI